MFSPRGNNFQSALKLNDNFVGVCICAESHSFFNHPNPQNKNNYQMLINPSFFPKQKYLYHHGALLQLETNSHLVK